MKTTCTSNRPNCFRKFVLTAQFCLIINVLFPSIAHAYVDPGSGSVIVTTILGLIAAVGYTFRKYFYKIKRMLTGKSADQDENQEQDRH